MRNIHTTSPLYSFIVRELIRLPRTRGKTGINVYVGGELFVRRVILSWLWVISSPPRFPFNQCVAKLISFWSFPTLSLSITSHVLYNSIISVFRKIHKPLPDRSARLKRNLMRSTRYVWCMNGFYLTIPIEIRQQERIEIDGACQGVVSLRCRLKWY